MYLSCIFDYWRVFRLFAIVYKQRFFVCVCLVWCPQLLKQCLVLSGFE